MIGNGLMLGSATGFVADAASVETILAISGVSEGSSRGSIDVLYDLNSNAYVQAVLYRVSEPDPVASDFGDNSQYLALGGLGLSTLGTVTLGLPDGLVGGFRVAFLTSSVVVTGPAFMLGMTALEPDIAIFGLGPGTGEVSTGGGTLVVSGTGSAFDGSHDISLVGERPAYVVLPVVSVEGSAVTLLQGLAIDRNPSATVTCHARLLRGGIEISTWIFPFAPGSTLDYTRQDADRDAGGVIAEITLTSSTGRTQTLTFEFVASSATVETSVGTLSNITRSNGDVSFDLTGAGEADGNYTFTAAEQTAGAKWLSRPTVAEGPAGTFTGQGDGLYIYVTEDGNGDPLAAPTVVGSWRTGGAELASDNSYTLTPDDSAQRIDYVATLFTALGGTVATTIEVQAEVSYIPQVVNINANVRADTSAGPVSDHVALMSWFKVTGHRGFEFFFATATRDSEVRNGEFKAVLERGDGTGGSSAPSVIAPVGSQVFVAAVGSPDGGFRAYISIDGGPLVAGDNRSNAAGTTWKYQDASFALYTRYSGDQGVIADYARHVVALPRASFDIEAPGMIDKLREAGTGLPSAPALNSVEWSNLLIDDRDTAARRALGKHFGTMGDLTVVTGTHTQVSP